MRRTSRRSLRTSIPAFIAAMPRSSRHRSGFRPVLSQLEGRTLLAIVTWINPDGGDWDTPANWSSGGLPGPSDDVVIDLPGITVTHSSTTADSVNSLTISASDSSLDLSNGSLSITSTSLLAGDLTMEGGTLSAADTLTVGGSMAWTGGTISGTGTLAAQGGLTVGHPVDPTAMILSGIVLDNFGTATANCDSFDVENGAVFNNEPGATFYAQSNTFASFNWNGQGAVSTFNNLPGATFDSTAANFINMGLVFNNDGTVEVNAGELNLGDSADPSLTATSSGSFQGAAGTTLGFAYVNQNLTAASSINASNVSFSATLVNDAGSYNASNSTSLPFAATVNFTGTVINLGAALDILGNSTADFSPGTPETVTASECTLDDGTLSGTDNFLITGPLTLSSFSLATTGTVDALGGISITGGTSPGTNFVSVTLNNYGTAIWNDSINAANGAVFNNEPGATFYAQSDTFASFNWNGQGAVPTFNNLPGATFESTAANFINMGLVFNNDGTVEVNAGELNLGDSADPSLTATSSGSFQGAAGTTLGFAYVNQNLTAASTINASNVSFSATLVNDAGSYNASNSTSLPFAATVNFTGTVSSVGDGLDILGNSAADFSPGTPGTVTTSECTLDNSTLSGTDNFLITGPLTLSSFSLATTGTVDALGGISITGGTSPGTNFVSVTLNNYGTTMWNDSINAANGAVFNNEPGATFYAQSDTFASFNWNGQGAVPTFNNLPGATFESTAGDFIAIEQDFNNEGTVNIEAGAFYVGGNFPGAMPVSNAGTVTVGTGSMLIVLADYNQTDGSTWINGGAFSGADFNIEGGTLVGSGVVNADTTNAGLVIPGGNGGAGVLTINGNYTQTVSGSLDIDIGGTTAGSEYDQLAVSGAAMLSGTIDVSLINGFLPTLGDSFTPLTFASSSGNFGFYNGIGLGNRLILDPTLNPGNLTLTVQAAVTTTTLAAPLSPSVSGQSVTFTANVTVALPPTTIDPVATGTVTFYDGGTSIGTGSLSMVNGQDQAAFTTSTLSTAAHSITAAYTSGDSNFIPSTDSTAVTQVVNKANTSASVASSGTPSVHGQSVLFTATVSVVSPGSTAVAYPTDTVTFYDGGTSIGTGTLSVVSGQDQATFTTSALSTATHSITAAYTSGDGNFNASLVSQAITQVVNKDGTTTTAGASPSAADLGQTVTFTATVTANTPGLGTPTGTVDFFDTTTNTDLTPGGVGLSSGTATFATTSLAAGPHTIKATYCGDGNFITSYATAGTVTVGQSIIVLDTSAGGALSLSGNASINLPGGVFVNSSSSTALSASGNAQIKATVIDVHGGVSKSGNASFSPAPVTGAAVTADPYASLTEPSTTGLTNYGSISLSGNSSKAISQGIYTQIAVSGNATLTMNSGLYVIEGGGLSISGNASVTGTGVTIFNAGSKYPTTGGTYGSIFLSGNGTYDLTPPTSGTYAGIVIYQSRDNSKALTISGNASGMTGTIYAPAAALTESGNAQLNASIDVDTLSISGNGVSNTIALSSPTGTVAYSPAQIRSAYGISSLAYDGAGETIAIVDAYDDPSIFQGVDTFDSQFGLTTSGPTLYQQYGPASSFLTVLNQYGQATSLPSTDPSGPGTDNWEVEEALDVEWTHAIAPGAQIILVEANSQSLSDLMAGVATAAAQPGVSVVSMSWGFAEGQAVFAGDEAAYDNVFNVPGVTFVASTGDYGAADPEYPAFSPNVLAVGGTSLTLNGGGSYGSETGWGYLSSSAGTFIGSGGGVSLYEPEPAYQQGVQSTGMRTTPDVSLVADPATGAWIADTYNLDPRNPFEVVGGTSLSAPAWAGLFALVNQGRAAAGEATLNRSSPTDAQEALYMLPQTDYNAIASGSNGYTAGARYNLVTGLGTPVANLLVPDLVAYDGPGTLYAGPTVGALQNANLANTGVNDSGPMDVFSVFDSLTVTSDGVNRNGAVTTVDASVERGLARPVRATERTAIPTLDWALEVLQDENVQETLIGDLAFEQVAKDPRRA